MRDANRLDGLYFVEDLPRSCFYCDCCHEKEYNHRQRLSGIPFCGIENLQVDYYYDYNLEDNNGRPNWCPLREIPDDCLDKFYEVGL